MMKTCKNCGIEFGTKSIRPWNEKYCSDKCKNHFFNQKYYYQDVEKNRVRGRENYQKRVSTMEGRVRVKRTNIRAVAMKRFGIEDREKFFAEFDHTCVFCGSKGVRLVIHHLDRHGRNVKEPNNDENNLVPCCYTCHPKQHHKPKKSQMKI